MELEFDDIISSIFGRSKGYEVCLVEKGTFVRGKDQEGGDRNWNWSGCVARDTTTGTVLEFYEESKCH